MKLPTYAEHRTFVERDGWQHTSSRRGPHDNYQKILSNGHTLYTRISRGRGQYRSESLWNHILRQQLEVTEQEFWRVLREGGPARRDGLEPSPQQATQEKPYWLVKNLLNKVKLGPDEVERMTLDEALAAWNEFTMRTRNEEEP